MSSLQWYLKLPCHGATAVGVVGLGHVHFALQGMHLYSKELFPLSIGKPVHGVYGPVPLQK